MDCEVEGRKDGKWYRKKENYREERCSRCHLHNQLTDQEGRWVLLTIALKESHVPTNLK